VALAADFESGSGEAEGNGPLGRSGREWENNIKMLLKQQN